MTEIGRGSVTPEKMTRRHQVLTELLNAVGITLNGDQPWDIQVHHPKFLDRILAEGSLGLGESYMAGWWDCQSIDQLISRGLHSDIYQYINSNYLLWFYVLKSKIFNLQTKFRSKQVANIHYNLDNDLYQKMLGPTMAYTCGYWVNAEGLDDAQHRKFDLICRKLAFESGEQVLELGCGWGGFAKFAAEHYGVEVTAVNIAKEQIAYAKSQVKDLPIHYHLCDYREASIYNPKGIRFDKVVSIGLCEHIGYKNYPSFVDQVAAMMKDDGLFLLHTIGSNTSVTHIEPWHGKYIFPGGMLPSPVQLTSAIEGHFVVEDWHNFGPDYDKTLMAWFDNFDAAWETLQDRYDARFYRMWCYYLKSCAGMFRARDAQLWQLVLSKAGKIAEYASVR